MSVVEYRRTSHLHLAQAQVHGNRFGDVEEASVAAYCEGEPIEGLQNVRSLVDVEKTCGCWWEFELGDKQIRLDFQILDQFALVNAETNTMEIL